VSRTKVSPIRTHAVAPGEERRRSQRVMIQVPVSLTYTVAGQSVTVRAHTVSVNDHGAMILCTRAIDSGTRLELQNDRSRQRQPGRVTRAPRYTSNGFLVPVEFDAPVPGFWGISFPPTDWKPPDD